MPFWLQQTKQNNLAEQKKSKLRLKDRIINSKYFYISPKSLNVSQLRLFIDCLDYALEILKFYS